MNYKIIGFGSILVMILLIGTQLQQDLSSSDDSKELLLPGLRTNLEAVSGIQIFGNDGSVRVSIEHRGNQWQISEKSDFAADFSVISKLLRDLADSEIAERKTARAENHELLGLGKQGDDAGRIVRIVADQRYEIMIGSSARNGGTFVRKPDDDQVYLVSEALDFGEDPIDYVNPVFFSLDSLDVQRVSIATNGSLLEALRDVDTGDMMIEKLPQGAELRYDTIADSLARTFVNLRLEDVEPYQEDLFTEPSRTTVTTSSGDSHTILSQALDQEYWVQMDQQWQYRVSKFTFDQLNKTVQDMLKSESASDD